MPDNSKETKTPIFSFDKAKVEAKLSEITSFLEGFAGKRGYNPYFQLNQIKNLRERVNAGEATEALQNQILALEKKEPVVVPSNVGTEQRVIVPKPQQIVAPPTGVGVDLGGGKKLSS